VIAQTTHVTRTVPIRRHRHEQLRQEVEERLALGPAQRLEQLARRSGSGPEHTFRGTDAPAGRVDQHFPTIAGRCPTLGQPGRDQPVDRAHNPGGRQSEDRLQRIDPLAREQRAGHQSRGEGPAGHRLGVGRLLEGLHDPGRPGAY